MRVLVTGASGFIGSAVVARLHAGGHEVVAVVRSRGPAVRRLPAAGLAVVDIARATRPADWIGHLAGIDAVVNCAGVLQDSPTDSTEGVHVTGIDALFAACETAGVRRVVHLSAIGVDRGAASAFSRTKLAGDERLMARDLDWVILRPAVVVGRAAFGGSALFRGLAALPVVPVMPDTGPVQVVQRDQLVETVLFFLAAGAPTKIAVEVAGPERLSMEDIVRRYRRWFGWRPARPVRLPAWMAAAAYRLGDLAGLLGWRPPIRTTARREIVRGAVGDPSLWSTMTGLAPQSLDAELATEPASVQERWFAQLYFVKPVVIVILTLFWVLTGLISLGPGFDIGTGLLEEGGLAPVAGLGVIAGALADIVIGIGIAWRRTARTALYGALALCVFYLVTGTILVPRLWIDPLGPMLKIFPIFMLHVVALATLDDR